MLRITCLFAVLAITGSIQAQKLPAFPNSVDSKQQRQGRWSFWMDAAWQPTTDSSQVAYYRLITYRDDKPIGLVTDYYRNGIKQYEGMLLQDRPEEILDGIHTWYYPGGQKRIVENYIQGEPSGDPSVYLRSGEQAEENWVENYRNGEQLSDEKKYELAAVQFKIALENAEAFLGRETEEYASVADWLSIVYGILQNYDETIRYEEEYVQVRKMIHPAPDTMMVSALADLGSYYKLTRNWEKAKVCFREYLDYNSRYFHGDHPDFADAIQTYGTVCAALHEYDNALEYMTQAKIIFDAHPEKYEYPRLSNTFSLSTLYLTMGQFAKGEQLLSGELKQLKSKYGERSEFYITALGSLARLHFASGQYALATKEWSDQLGLVKATQGEQADSYASTLGCLAEVAIDRGNVMEADRLIRQARKIFESNKTADESYLTFLEKCSTLYSSMGYKAIVREISGQRLDLARKLFGAESLTYARVLVTQVDIAFLDKDWETCMNLGRKALEIYKRYEVSSLSEQERVVLALLHSRIGSVYLLQILSAPDRDRLASAEKEIRTALELFASLPEKKFNMLEAETYLMLATVHEVKKEPSKADSYYQFVLTHARKKLGEAHPSLIEILFLIAKKSEIRKEYKTSMSYYREALDRHRKYISDVFPSLSETEKEEFYAHNKLMLTSFLGFATQYHSQVPGLAELLCNEVLTQKGIILDSFQPIQQALLSAGDTTLLKEFNRWQVTKNQLAKQLQQVDSNQDTLKYLSDALNELEKDITSRSSNFGVVFKNKSSSWKDIQNILGPSDAAVEIIYTIEDRAEGYDTAYHAIVIRPGLSEPTIVRLVHAHQAEGKSFRLYKNSIAARLEDRSSYDTYWKTIVPSLAGAKKVYVSPDGIYHQINLGALLSPTGNRYLSEEYYVVSIPSMSMLLRTRSSGRLTQATLFAHPDYGAVPTQQASSLTRSLDLDQVADLPGTEKELNDIASLLEQNSISLKQFEGAAATEENLKQIKQPMVLHIATHGYFLPPNVQANGAFQNPLLESGLLFAQCQRKPHLTNPAREDGLLTAYEASTLPLFKTNLVILSACETGLGQVKNGEGVYGLQRAFLMAGARRVMMSLWKVDDEATHQFMVAFYDAWIKTGSIDQAYQSAQTNVRQSHPEPYYWAAFVLTGY